MGDPRPIGFFDSGVGGLTVLREVVRRLPAESTLYLGDNERTPYGPRPDAEVVRFSIECLDVLAERDVKAIVVDDWTCLGSANLDALSLLINAEVNIAFTDPKATSTLVRDLFLTDFKKSKKLERKDVKDWDDPLSETISKQL